MPRAQPRRGPPAGGSSTGVEIVYPDGFFKEFVVRFDGTGKTVAEINRALLDHGIFGGKDLSADLPGSARARSTA